MLGSLLLASPSPAEACSAPECNAFDRFLGAAEVPANVPGIVWYPAGYWYSVGEARPLSLVRTDGEEEEVIPFSLTEQPDGGQLIAPDDGFVAGATYEVRLSDYEGDGGGVAVCGELAPYEFTAVDQVPFPSSLGALEVSEQEVVGIPYAVSDGSCYDTVPAVTRTVRVALDEEDEIWRELLVFETFVDGQAWSNAFASKIAGYEGDVSDRIAERGSDLLHAVCGDDDSTLGEGTHTVRIQASLPGTDVLLSEETEFTFTCDGDDNGDPGSQDGEDGVDGVETKNAGAGCSVNRDAPSGGAAGLVLIVLGVAVRSAHRRRRTHRG